MKYAVIYKCPLCGRLIQREEMQQVSQEPLPELLAKFMRGQLLAENPTLYETPMYILCQCSDGNAGMAAFAGFKRMES